MREQRAAAGEHPDGRRRDKPWIFRTYAGPFDGGEVQRALSQEPGQGPDRPFHRLRPADPDGLRQRPRAGARRGRQGRRAGLASRRHARAARRHPARPDEHVDDDQRDGARGCLSLYVAVADEQGAPARQAHGHDPERHHQGISLARHLRVPARAVAAADQGHDRLLGTREVPKWNPTNVCSYHLQEAGATPVQELAYALATAHGRARHASRPPAR